MAKGMTEEQAHDAGWQYQGDDVRQGEARKPENKAQAQGYRNGKPEQQAHTKWAEPCNQAAYADGSIIFPITVVKNNTDRVEEKIFRSEINESGSSECLPGKEQRHRGGNIGPGKGEDDGFANCNFAQLVKKRVGDHWRRIEKRDRGTTGDPAHVPA